MVSRSPAELVTQVKYSFDAQTSAHRRKMTYCDGAELLRRNDSSHDLSAGFHYGF